MKKLESTHVNQFKKYGFIQMDGMFSLEEINLMKSELPLFLAMNSEKKILEKNGSMRSFFAPHEESEILNNVNKLDRLVSPAMQLLDSDVYIHQTKINSKQAMVGDWWEWHQDFPYWHIEDGMPLPRVLTAMIFLDEVNEFNGPMLLVPGSNKAGLTDIEENSIVAESDNEWFNQYQLSKEYMSDLTSNLKYTLKKETLQKWVTNNAIYSSKGIAGTVLFFDGLVFHASSNNMSPWNRNTYLITYNSVANKLNTVAQPRPGFLANRDFSPIQTVSELIAD